MLKGFMANCPSVTADWDVVGNWFKYWQAQGMTKVYAKAYHNAVTNMATVKSDVAMMTADYDKRDYYTTAVAASTLAKMLLPVPSLGTQTCTKPDGEVYTLDTMEIADYLSGLMAGFTGNNHKDYME